MLYLPEPESFVVKGIFTPSGGSRGGGLRGLDHPPRSKFRLQRELTGVINSFSSAKTHCGEPMRSYNARTLNYDHTHYVNEHAQKHAHAQNKGRGPYTCVRESSPLTPFLEPPLTPVNCQLVMLTNTIQKMGFTAGKLLLYSSVIR